MQIRGSSAMEKMGEKAKSFTDDVDSNLVIDFTSTMLGAGSNMLRAACITVPVVDEDKTDPQLLVCIFKIRKASGFLDSSLFTLDLFKLKVSQKPLLSYKVPVNDTEEEPIANRFQVPLSFYADDDYSEDFPEDRFDSFVAVKQVQEENDKELRIQV